MQANYERMINDVIKTINWSRVKYFHTVFGIKWQFSEKSGYVVERFPTIAELKQELKTLLEFIINKNLRTIDYSNWLIYWTDEETAKREGLHSARIEAVFSLEDALVIDSANENHPNVISELKQKMKDALSLEKYEEAARIRDRILSIEEKNKTQE